MIKNKIERRQSPAKIQGVLDKEKGKVEKLLQHSTQQKVADQLGIHVYTVQNFIRRHNIKYKTLNERFKEQQEQAYNSAKEDIKNRINDSLFITGLTLYWGEGFKTGGNVGVSNADPSVVKLFLKWLRKYCNINEAKLNAMLHLYKNQDENEAINYWSKQLQIPKERFHKTQFVTKQPARSKQINKYGVGRVQYSSKELLYRIKGWIAGLYEHLMNEELQEFKS